MSTVLCSQCAAPLSLQEVEGRVPCRFCGAVNRPDRPQSAPGGMAPAVDMTPIRCAACGEENRGMLFCRRCGGVLGASAAPAPAERGVPCPQCGKENARHYDFCLGCGASMRAAPMASPNHVGPVASPSAPWLFVVVAAVVLIGIGAAVVALFML